MDRGDGEAERRIRQQGRRIFVINLVFLVFEVIICSQ